MDPWSVYESGIGKIVPVRTRLEIYFIVYYNSHTQGLSRYSDTIAIDKKVCFYRQLLPTISSHAGPTQKPVGPLGCINTVACGPKLFHLASTLIVVWSGLLWPSYVHGIHDISGSVQNISQNQPVHPVAI